jgi:hypothetical protein
MNWLTALESVLRAIDFEIYSNTIFLDVDWRSGYDTCLAWLIGCMALQVHRANFPSKLRNALGWSGMDRSLILIDEAGILLVY